MIAISYPCQGIMSRNIAAPFQHLNGTGDQPVPAIHQAARGDYLDYTNSSFESLESIPDLTLQKYCGPTPESNWVIHGKLLVGAYPASQSDVETFELIISILKLKINTFVCLQQEYRTRGVTEAMWRSGHALRPYFEDVKLIIKNRSMFKSLSEHPGIVDSENLDFVHFPIRDCSISDDAAVLKLSQSLVARIHKGEVLYLHCWGGHGRTGTVVCIMLHLMYGLSAVDAMAYCQRVHDLRQCPVKVGSPQTETQRDQVRRVIAALVKHRRAAAVGPPPKVTYPPVASAAHATGQLSRDYHSAEVIHGRTPKVNDLDRETNQINSGTISNTRNNIAARTSPVAPIQIPISTTVSAVATPPSTPPTSSSGKRGGRNITSKSGLHSEAGKEETVPSAPQDPLPSSRRPGSGKGSRSTSPVSTPRSSVQKAELHPHRVNIEIPMEDGRQLENAHIPSNDSAEATAKGETVPSAPQDPLPSSRRPGSGKGSRPTSPVSTPRSSVQKAELHPDRANTEIPMEDGRQLENTQHKDIAEITASPPLEEEKLKQIIPDIVEGKTVKPHLGLYPMVRMPTERMKSELEETRRRGSKSIAPNLATVADAMELSSEDVVSSNRRMSAGTVMAHNIILNAMSNDPSPAAVPVTTPLTPIGDNVISRTESGTSDGHTSHSATSVGNPSESIDMSESTIEEIGVKKSLDSIEMDIDTESGIRPASATSPTIANKTTTVLSSGASTFLGFQKKA